MNPVTIGRKGPTENNVDIEQNGPSLSKAVDSVTMQIFLNNQKGATENQTFTYIPQENDSNETAAPEERVENETGGSLLPNGESPGIGQLKNQIPIVEQIINLDNQAPIDVIPQEQRENVEPQQSEVLNDNNNNDPQIQPAIVRDQNPEPVNQDLVNNGQNILQPIVPGNRQPVAIPADNINLLQLPAQNQGGPVDNRPNNLQPFDPLQQPANEVHRPRNPGNVDINGRQFRIRLIRGGQDINPAPEQLADLVLRTQRLCNDLLQVNNTIFNGASRINFNLAGKEITYINRQANNQNHSIKFNQDYISHTVDGQITPYNLHQDQVDRLVTRFDGLHHSILQLQPRRPDEEEDDDQDRVNNNAQLDNNNQMLDDLDDLIEEDLNVEEDD